MRMLFTAIAMLCASPAMATGGFGCEADDDKATVTLEALATHGMGSPILRFRGLVELKNADVAADLRSTEFEGLAQYWSHDDELRLLAYKERNSTTEFGSVQLVVKTKFEDDGDLVGRYSVEITDVDQKTAENRSVMIEGDITCMLE